MEAIIQIKNLTTSINNQTIHENLSCNIQQGQITAIIGGSGSGKSVLLKTILGLFPIQSGEILFENQSNNFKELRDKIGIQFQQGALLSSFTAGENIMLPLIYKAGLNAEGAQAIAQYKMELTGLALSHFNKYPDTLSGGMIKRVAVARAIALDPLILFLDEPTSGLDPISAKEYDKLILTLHKALKVTIVMITHDLLRVQNLANQVMIIHNKQAYTGTYAEMQNNPDPELKKYLMFI